MIKRDKDYSFMTSKWFPTGTLSCRSRLKSRWYNLDSHVLSYGWKKKEEEVLAPTCLSTWSK